MQLISEDEIANLTLEYGGEWGLNHTRRLLHLIALIGADQKYNAEIVRIAAYLHDWGAYTQWEQKGVDHALRSKQVAEAFLQKRNCPHHSLQRILECIEFHHSGDPQRSLESVLLSDADGLDFLGLVGLARDFSKNPKALKKGYEAARKRREKVPGLLVLPLSKTIAAQRIKEMDDLFALFEKDSFGCY